MTEFGPIQAGGGSMMTAMSAGPSAEFLACQARYADVRNAEADDEALGKAFDKYVMAIKRLAANRPPSIEKLFELQRLARMEAKGPVREEFLIEIDYISIEIFATIDALMQENSAIGGA